jgi:tetratricopeptide (TPR) repeat protein
VPKISDFGLAKDLAQGDRTLSGAVLGTPNYMPPEQAAGRNREIGPASDVYSLGAILYECLTGRPPFAASSSSETLLQVLHNEPVPVRRLQPQTPRDLETVCMKCLQKEPRRRYAAAADLADDLRRFLDNRPVQARPVGPLEMGVKWVRRRPVDAALIAAVALLFLTLTVGLWVALYVINGARLEEADARREAQLRSEDNRRLAEDEEAARKKAEKAAAAEAKARRTAELHAAWLAAVFQAPDPLGLNGVASLIPKTTGENLTVRELLARAVKTLEKEAKDEPETLAKLYDTLGNAHRSLGLYSEAERLLTRGLDLRREMYGENNLDTAASLHNVGWLYHDLGHYDRALDYYTRALAIRTKQLPPDDPQVLDSRMNIAWLHSEMGDHEIAVREWTEVIDLRVKKFGEDHRTVAIARLGLAAVLTDEGEYLKAFPLTQKALKTFTDLEGDQNLANAVAKFQLAVFQREVLHNRAAALKLLSEARDLTEKSLGKNHVYVGLIIHEQGVTAFDADLAQSEKFFLEALAIAESQVGLEHPRTVVLVQNLTDVYARRGKPDEGVKLYEKQLKALRDRFGDRHRFTATARSSFGSYLYRLRRYDRAEAELSAAAAAFRECKPVPVRERCVCLHELSLACLARQKPAEAEKAIDEALPLLRESKRVDLKSMLASSLDNLAWARLDQGRKDGVAEVIDESLALYKSLLSEKQSGYAAALGTAFRYYREARQPAAAAGCLRERRKLVDKDSAALVEVARCFAQCAAEVGQSGSSPADAAQEERGRYLDESLEALRQAVKRGYRGAAEIKQDATLAPLRDRPEFQQLLNEIAMLGTSKSQ